MSGADSRRGIKRALGLIVAGPRDTAEKACFGFSQVKRLQYHRRGK